ncbi:hypothetical protein KAU33_10095 [Candidatus Dependentiae bacterium]|nr:hypothetical protein [Candidatus Dependentiae bacterium]
MKYFKPSLVFFLVILSVSVFGASYTRTTGEYYGIDIPTAYILNNGQVNITQGFAVGKFEKFNPEREDGSIYSDGDLKVNLGLFDFIEIGLLFYNEKNIVGNLQVLVLKEDPEKKFIPGIAIGAQNISGEKHISPEGKQPEFDHFYSWTKDGELQTWEEDQFENNSFYIVSSKNFNNILLLHFGIGLGRFVGHSGWSGVQSFNDSDIAIFYGLSYNLPILKDPDKTFILSMDADGRDWNIDTAFKLKADNSTHLFHVGAAKIEHWFKDVAFQPKFTFGYSILFNVWRR